MIQIGTGGILAGIVSALLVTVPASPSQASTQCQATSPTNWHVGWSTDRQHTSYQSFRGSYARVKIRNAAYCSGGSGKFTNVYVMLHDNLLTTAPLVFGYAQAGYEKSPGDGIRHFAQARDQYSLSTWYSVGHPSLGATADYKVKIPQVPPGNVGGYVDGTLKAAATTTGWDEPYELEFSGEASHRQMNIPGTTNYPATLSRMQFFTNVDNGWHGTPCSIFGTFNQAPSRWHKSAINCDKRKVWTNPVS